MSQLRPGNSKSEASMPPSSCTRRSSRTSAAGAFGPGVQRASPFIDEVTAGSISARTLGTATHQVIDRVLVRWSRWRGAFGARADDDFVGVQHHVERARRERNTTVFACEFDAVTQQRPVHTVVTQRLRANDCQKIGRLLERVLPSRFGRCQDCRGEGRRACRPSCLPAAPRVAEPRKYRSPAAMSFSDHSIRRPVQPFA